MTDLGNAGGIALVSVSCLWLAACGGSSASGPTVAPIEEQGDGRILAGGRDIVPADFLGRTFPLVFAEAEARAPTARTQAGVGTVEVVNADTLRVTIGQTERLFARVAPGSTSFTDQSGLTAEIEDYGPARHLFVETPSFGVSMAYGFETPVGARPVSATYNARSASVVVLTLPGRDSFIEIGGPGSVNLVASFTGSGGRITGTLLDTTTLPGGRARVDLLGTGSATDDVFLRTTLDGTITDGGFTGTVSGTARASLNGGTDTDLNLSLTGTTVAGRFFGPAAQAVAGTYAGDAEVTLPGQGPQTGTLTGFFIGD